MGTPDFAVPSLKALLDAGYDIPLVLTQPDKRGNRGKVIPSPVKVLAEANGIEILQPFSLRKDAETITAIKKAEPDFIVVSAYGQILPQSVLDIPRYGCINVHGSLLPDLRGASPMQTAILRGYEKTGVTIMKMEAGLDTGAMISKVDCEIEKKNIKELAGLLADIGAKLLVDTLPSIADGTAVFTEQDDSLSSYAKLITKADGMTDFNEPADVIERKIRAYYEWPTVYSYLDGQQVKFYSAEELMDEAPSADPGTIARVEKDFFTINCAKGQLKITELQLQGKNRMKTADFLRGRRLDINNRFTVKED